MVFLSGFFYLAKGTSVLLCVLVVHSFLLLKSIPLYGYITVYLFIYQLIGIWTIFVSWAFFMCLYVEVFISFGQIPRNGIAGSNGTFTSIFIKKKKKQQQKKLPNCF